MKFASYSIQYGYGLGGIYDVDRFGNIIASSNLRYAKIDIAPAISASGVVIR